MVVYIRSDIEKKKASNRLIERTEKKFSHEIVINIKLFEILEHYLGYAGNANRNNLS